MKIVIPFCALLLALVSISWLEPVLFLVTIGFAIVLNLGTNLLFGEISYVTKIAGSVLQLAVSLDYSLFLLHRFEECRKEIADPQQAMVEALCLATPSILASGWTTVMDFAALMAMEFGIGSDTLPGQQQAAMEEVFGQSNTFVLLVPKGNFGKEQALNVDLQRLPQINSVVSYVQTVGAEIPMEYLDEAILSQLISEHYSCIVLVADVPSEGDEAFALVQQLEQLAAQYYSDNYQLAGDTVSTFDLKKTIESNQRRVNLLVITAIFLILLLTMKSLALPLLLLLVMETSVWLNLSVPYFADQHLFFIAYLIISSIQLGATVDYAILQLELEAYGAQLQQAVIDLQRLYQGIYELYDGLVILQQGSAELLEGLEQLKSGAAQLEQGAIVLQNGTATLYEGVVALKDGSYALMSGTVDFSEGTVTLADGMVQLNTGAVVLCDGAIELENGLIELQGSTMQFRDRTANLDSNMLAQLRAGIK